MSQKETSKVYKYRSQEGIEATRFIWGDDMDDWLFSYPSLLRIYDIEYYKDKDPKKYEQRLAVYNILKEEQRVCQKWYDVLDEMGI
jgi:hypothetical protein